MDSVDLSTVQQSIVQMEPRIKRARLDQAKKRNHKAFEKLQTEVDDHQRAEHITNNQKMEQARNREARKSTRNGGITKPRQMCAEKGCKMPHHMKTERPLCNCCSGTANWDGTVPDPHASD